jgi:hypothetical protein
MSRLKRSGLVLTSALALVACGHELDTPEEEADARLALFAAPCASPAPLRLAPGEKLPGSFIIVYDDSLAEVDARTTELADKYGFTTKYRWKTAIKGFSATLQPETVAALLCEEDVLYIEENGLAAVDDP